jgi:hypothetical protein
VDGAADDQTERRRDRAHRDPGTPPTPAAACPPNRPTIRCRRSPDGDRPARVPGLCSLCTPHRHPTIRRPRA